MVLIRNKGESRMVKAAGGAVTSEECGAQLQPKVNRETGVNQTEGSHKIHPHAAQISNMHLMSW